MPPATRASSVTFAVALSFTAYLQQRFAAAGQLAG